MKKSHRLACLALAATFTSSSVALSGCHHKETEETAETTKISETTTVATEVSDEETEETTESSEWIDPDKANEDLPKGFKDEALEVAEKVGLTDEDLRGEYEYFLQFAETVDGNPSLYEYEGYVYQLFPMIADHIDEENKDYFLDQLKNLVIENGEAGPDAAAYYACANNYILIGGWVFNVPDCDASLTVYHELIHFVDNTISEADYSSLAVMNDGSIVKSDELTEEQLSDVKEYVNSNFFTESGDEHYVAKYFGNANSPMAYNENVAFMIALEYIIGTERFDSIFFAPDTTYQFFKLMQEYDFTDDEIIKIMETLNHWQDEDDDYDINKMMNPQEAIVKMYEKEFSTDYKDDLLFCEFLANMENTKYFPSIAPYPRKFTVEMIEDWKALVADKYGVDVEDIGLMNYPEPVFVGDEIKFGTLFTVFFKNDFGRSEGGVFQFTYDFEKDEIIEYEARTCDWVPGEVNDKFKNEKSSGAKDLIESLKADNSEAHDQTVKGTDSTLEAQYKKASEIGSKHGVYFWFADLTPDGLLNDDKIASDPSKIDAALDEIGEVLDLYPEDYFDQLLFEYYQGFAICLYDGNYEHFMRGSYCVNGDYYMIININISNPSLESFYGADTVRKMGFNSVSIMKTQLICEIWKCTEKFFSNYDSHFEQPAKGYDSWKKVNQPYFSYADTTEDELIDFIMTDYYDWDYFLCKECVTFRETDRNLLYEYMMLSAITGYSTDLTPEVEKKIDEIQDEIRHFFDTDNWPDETIWESI